MSAGGLPISPARCLGLIVLVMRMWIPESPRWLMIHGRPDEAHAIVDDIERSAIGHTQNPREQAFAEDQAEDARPHAAGRSRAYAVLDLSPAFAGGIDADGRAGVLLQCDLLHLCAGADRFLRHRRRPCRLVHPALCGRQLPGTAVARAPVRYARPAHHDRADLWRLRRPAGAVGLSVLDRRFERADARPSPGW